MPSTARESDPPDLANGMTTAIGLLSTVIAVLAVLCFLVAPPFDLARVGASLSGSLAPVVLVGVLLLFSR